MHNILKKCYMILINKRYSSNIAYALYAMLKGTNTDGQKPKLNVVYSFKKVKTQKTIV